MRVKSKISTRATAYGAADALAPGTQGASEKWATGQKTTAFGTTDAPALGTQGAGDKSTTGQKRKKYVTPKTEIRIAGWNVRTGHHVGQIEIIARELVKCKISVAALSELRFIGSGTKTVVPPDSNETMTLYYSGGKKREAGVGFMVDAKAARSKLAFQPVSERLAVLTLKGTVNTHVVAAYAPTETSSGPAKDEFYAHLQHTLDLIPRTELTILAGDFNAHVGTDRSGWEATMGNFGHGEINDNGLRLLTFAVSNNLVVGNTCFQHPQKHKLTWRNPAGQDSAVLDYIMISSRFRSSLRDVRAMRGPDCGSDHYLVRARLKLRLRRAEHKKAATTRLDWKQLMNTTRKYEYQIALSNRFTALAESKEIEEEEKAIVGTILECARPLCPPIRRRTQPWISNECLELVDKRKQAKLVDHGRYRQLSKEVRLKMKTEREAYWNQVAADVEVAASKHEYRYLYSTLRRLGGKSKPTNNNIKKADGTFVRSSVERLQRWKEFFEEQYNHQPPQGPSAVPPAIYPPQSPMNDSEPAIEEVKVATRSLKSGKTPGVDQVTAEAIKAGGDILLYRLHSLVRKIWRTEQVPTTWRKAVIVPIHKKGDNQECKNYRGISLLSIVGKVFMRIIQSRLQRHHEQFSREEQAGFRPGRGCVDQIFSIRQLMEEKIRCGQRTVIVFIDFKSAFDNVHWPALWRALQTEHVPRKVVALLQSVYYGSSSQVRVQNELSEGFSIKTGVRQGDVTSPLLFNIVIDSIMRQAFRNRLGVQYDKNGYITDLMFADDCAILANSDAEATDTLRDIAHIAQGYGLTINAEKTKVLVTDGSLATVDLEGMQIEQVREFKYLGSLVEERKVAATSEIHSRIGQATVAFASLKWCLWKRAKISLKTKIRLFRTLILPILLYGSETWTVLKADLNKLEVLQMRCLRQILGISLCDHETNEDIRMRFQNQPSIEKQIEQRRLRWFGYICRIDASRLPHKLFWRDRPTHWKIQKTAPKKTWKQQIEDDLKKRRINLQQAKNATRDKKRWRDIVINNHVAPTAAYWLRGQSPPPDAS